METITNNFEDMDLLFLILSGKVSMLVNRALSRNFRAGELEITPEQFTVMSCLWKVDGVSQQELCDLTNKDKSSMTRLLHNLEKRGLAVRIADRSDRRNNRIHLTRQGKQMRLHAVEVAIGTVKEALTSISPAQIEICRQVLKKVQENLA